MNRTQKTLCQCNYECRANCLTVRDCRLKKNMTKFSKACKVNSIYIAPIGARPPQRLYQMIKPLLVVR